jgi:hypothetical protein
MGMTGQEDRLARIRDAMAALREAAVQEALAAYFARLGHKDYPAQHDTAAARDVAESTLKQRLCSPEWLSTMNGGKPVSKGDAARLKLSLGLAVPPLAVPAPQDASDVSPAALAIAAVVGAVGGMMALAPLTRVLLDMRDTGLFVGAPLGAFVLVLAVCGAAGKTWLRWLPLVRRRPRYDRTGYEQTIRSAIEQWLDGAILAGSVLLASGENGDSTKADREAMLYGLVGKVRSLSDMPPENLPFAVQELLQEVRNLGFAWEGAKTFKWAATMRDKFDTFGHVEPGDVVVVERDPVFFEKTVREKGLVRKARDRGQP